MAYPILDLDDAARAAGPPPVRGARSFHSLEPPSSFFKDGFQGYFSKFSTCMGQRPFRHVENPVDGPRNLRPWHATEINDFCKRLSHNFWYEIKNIEVPQDYRCLYKYFDAYDIYMCGAQNLWNVINHLCWMRDIQMAAIIPEVENDIDQEVRLQISKPSFGSKLIDWDPSRQKDILRIFNQDDLAFLQGLDGYYYPYVRNCLIRYHAMLQEGSESYSSASRNLPGSTSDVRKWLVNTESPHSKASRVSSSSSSHDTLVAEIETRSQMVNGIVIANGTSVATPQRGAAQTSLSINSSPQSLETLSSTGQSTQAAVTINLQRQDEKLPSRSQGSITSSDVSSEAAVDAPSLDQDPTPPRVTSIEKDLEPSAVSQDTGHPANQAKSNTPKAVVRKATHLSKIGGQPLPGPIQGYYGAVNANEQFQGRPQANPRSFDHVPAFYDQSYRSVNQLPSVGSLMWNDGHRPMQNQDIYGLPRAFDHGTQPVPHNASLEPPMLADHTSSHVNPHPRPRPHPNGLNPKQQPPNTTRGPGYWQKTMDEGIHGPIYRHPPLGHVHKRFTNPHKQQHLNSEAGKNGTLNYNCGGYNLNHDRNTNAGSHYNGASFNATDSGHTSNNGRRMSSASNRGGRKGWNNQIMTEGPPQHQPWLVPSYMPPTYGGEEDSVPRQRTPQNLMCKNYRWQGKEALYHKYGPCPCNYCQSRDRSIHIPVPRTVNVQRVFQYFKRFGDFDSANYHEATFRFIVFIKYADVANAINAVSQTNRKIIEGISSQPLHVTHMVGSQYFEPWTSNIPPSHPCHPYHLDGPPLATPETSKSSPGGTSLGNPKPSSALSRSVNVGDSFATPISLEVPEARVGIETGPLEKRCEAYHSRNTSSGNTSNAGRLARKIEDMARSMPQMNRPESRAESNIGNREAMSSQQNNYQTHSTNQDVNGAEEILNSGTVIRYPTKVKYHRGRLPSQWAAQPEDSNVQEDQGEAANDFTIRSEQIRADQGHEGTQTKELKTNGKTWAKSKNKNKKGRKKAAGDYPEAQTLGETRPDALQCSTANDSAIGIAKTSTLWSGSPQSLNNPGELESSLPPNNISETSQNLHMLAQKEDDNMWYQDAPFQLGSPRSVPGMEPLRVGKQRNQGSRQSGLSDRPASQPNSLASYSTGMFHPHAHATCSQEKNSIESHEALTKPSSMHPFASQEILVDDQRRQMSRHHQQVTSQPLYNQTDQHQHGEIKNEPFPCYQDQLLPTAQQDSMMFVQGEHKTPQHSSHPSEASTVITSMFNNAKLNPTAPSFASPQAQQVSSADTLTGAAKPETTNFAGTPTSPTKASVDSPSKPAVENKPKPRLAPIPLLPPKPKRSAHSPGASTTSSKTMSAGIATPERSQPEDPVKQCSPPVRPHNTSREHEGSPSNESCSERVERSLEEPPLCTNKLPSPSGNAHSSKPSKQQALRAKEYSSGKEQEIASGSPPPRKKLSKAGKKKNKRLGAQNSDLTSLEPNASQTRLMPVKGGAVLPDQTMAKSCNKNGGKGDSMEKTNTNSRADCPKYTEKAPVSSKAPCTPETKRHVKHSATAEPKTSTHGSPRDPKPISVKSASPHSRSSLSTWAGRLKESTKSAPTPVGTKASCKSKGASSSPPSFRSHSDWPELPTASVPNRIKRAVSDAWQKSPQLITQPIRRAGGPQRKEQDDWANEWPSEQENSS